MAPYVAPLHCATSAAGRLTMACTPLSTARASSSRRQPWPQAPVMVMSRRPHMVMSTGCKRGWLPCRPTRQGQTSTLSAFPVAIHPPPLLQAFHALTTAGPAPPPQHRAFKRLAPSCICRPFSLGTHLLAIMRHAFRPCCLDEASCLTHQVGCTPFFELLPTPAYITTCNTSVPYLR